MQPVREVSSLACSRVNRYKCSRIWGCSVHEHAHQHWSRCVHGVHEHMLTTIGLVHVHELNMRNCHEQAVNIYKSNNLAISQFFTIFSFFSALLTLMSCNKVVRDLLLHFQCVKSPKNIKNDKKKSPKNIFPKIFWGKCSKFEFVNMFTVSSTVHEHVHERSCAMNCSCAGVAQGDNGS